MRSPPRDALEVFDQDLLLVGLEGVGDGARERPMLVAEGGVARDVGSARDGFVRGAPIERRDLRALRELVAGGGVALRQLGAPERGDAPRSNGARR